MKRWVLSIALLLSFCTLERAECLGQQPAGTVYLGPSRDWALFSAGTGDARPLSREIVRQAFLIAAREELGLTTRDAWLGAPMPTEGDNAPWNFTAVVHEPVSVKLVRGFGSDSTELFQHELPSRVRARYSLNYDALTEVEERLSRTEFVEVLKKAGYTPRRNPQDEDLAVPEPIEAMLGQMNFLAQFDAARQLHDLLRSKGESPALLGALSRAYAHLGVLTEYYWHPAHKVFKARALLYAQRMLAWDDQSPLARWHRAYAAALAGEHRWALDDLKAADKARKKLEEDQRPEEPAWVQLIGPLCRYEVEAFNRSAQDPKLHELATLLQFLAVEQAGPQAWAVQTAMESQEVIPQCYRINDTLCMFGGVAALHSATLAPVMLVGQTLYDRVNAMPGLPEEVQKTTQKATEKSKTLLEALGAIVGKNLLPAGGEGYDPAEEFKRRRQLIDALLKTGELPAAKGADAASSTAAADSGEPAWDTLGLLIRELSFLQVVRRAQFERRCLDVPTEEWLTAATPLVQGHPYEAYLGTFSWHSDQVKEAVSRLAKVDRTGLGPNCLPLCFAVGSEPAANDFFGEVWRNVDYVVPDFVTMFRGHSGNLRGKEYTVWFAQTLLSISPQSPMAHVMLVKYDWDKIQDKLPEWEKEAEHFPGLASTLAERYFELERWADAERVLKPAIQILPTDLALYRQLASVYRKQGQLDRWVATLEAYLPQPDPGLGHFSVLSEIAYYYMEQRQWEKALPYAERAAECYSAWGLLCAAKCHEALRHWSEAEQFYRASSERYRDSSLDWYFFCRRTGEGDLKAAERLVDECLDNLSQSSGGPPGYDLVLYGLLKKSPETALPEMRKAVTRTEYPADFVWQALIADQLQDTEARDMALKSGRRFAADQVSNKYKPGGSDSQCVVETVDLLTKDLAAGGKGEIDLEAADKLCASWSAEDRLYFHYALAQYLNLHGQAEAAIRYFKQCMAYTGINARYRTLAGAFLLEHGIKPADYQELLQPPVEKADGEKQPSEESKSEEPKAESSGSDES